MSVPAFKQHITINPDIRSGKPHISGRRITVQDVVLWHERMGMTIDEISDQYDLALGEIYAALSYYFDNREAIDEGITMSSAFIDEMRKTTPSILTKRLAQLRGE